MQTLSERIGRRQIRATEKIIRPYIRRTAVLEIDGSEIETDSCRIVFKLELMQHSGSFKTRGAFANMLTRKVPRAGVVAASGGNHGAAVAFAARKLKKPAKIFVPSVASKSKMDFIRACGAELVIAGDRYAEALAVSEEWRIQSGAIAIHAYDQPATLLGQGTVGLELQQQTPDLDCLLVAVGGGGLIGGIAAWYSGSIQLIGVEPEAAPTLTYALQAGHPVDAPAGGIAADSLAPKRVGNLMFPFAQKYVHSMVLVSDESIRKAQQLLWERWRIVVEPGGAAALAALLSGGYVPQKGERIGVLLCGGNTDAVQFSES